MNLQRLPVDLNTKLTDFSEEQLHILVFAVTDYKREKIAHLKKKEDMYKRLDSTYAGKSISEKEIEAITEIETQLYTALGTVVMTQLEGKN